MMELRDLYQEVIIDHNRNPRNFHKMPNASCHAEGFNPLCGDKLELYLKIKNNVIAEVSFVGCGCAISTASASLMTDYLKGKTEAEAEEIFETFQDMIVNDSQAAANKLGKLSILAGVKEFPARVKCATLAWHTLHAALAKQAKPACTE